MRPDQLALKELDALVRNLGDQLAAFRRRALTAEARVRDVEQALADAMERLEATRGLVEVARREAAEVSQARAAGLVPMRPGADAPQDAGPTVGASVAGGADDSEAARLRLRLAEARDRTRLMADRVRFLRQQLAQGAEK